MRLLHQLKSTFDRGGLRNRDGSVSYKELLKNCDVPVMVIAGDRDLICPPSAVIGETVKFTSIISKKVSRGSWI